MLTPEPLPDPTALTGDLMCFIGGNLALLGGRTPVASFAAADDPTAAFNAGSDARLNGEPLESCPYHSHDERQPYLEWRAGWRDVEKNFGRWARGRWLYRGLCAVKVPGTGSLEE